MKPIPVVFHIGPLQIHTYGIGLAVTFWFAYRYFARRLRGHGYPDEWLGRAFVWIIVSSIAGARAVHVIANWSFYSAHPGDILAIWHGGLSSYGGLLLGVPVGLWCAHKWCRQLGLVVALDLVSPVLALAWSIGRLLGPQLMVRGGGRVTTAWYGMYYAGEAGRRVPVPILQAIECFLIWVIALQVEKWVRRRGHPLGLVTTAVVTLYGLARFFDEYVWLPHGSGGVAVEGASIAFVVAGVIFAAVLVRKDRRRPASEGDFDPWGAPAVEGESTDTAAESPPRRPSEAAAAGRGGPGG